MFQRGFFLGPPPPEAGATGPLGTPYTPVFSFLTRAELDRSGSTPFQYVFIDTPSGHTKHRGRIAQSFLTSIRRVLRNEAIHHLCTRRHQRTRP